MPQLAPGSPNHFLTVLSKFTNCNIDLYLSSYSIIIVKCVPLYFTIKKCER